MRSILRSARFHPGHRSAGFRPCLTVFLAFFLSACSGLPSSSGPEQASSPQRSLRTENRPSPLRAPESARIARVGQTRALVLFVQFRDDLNPGDPCLDYRGWPLSDRPTDLPSFAHNLLAAAPTPPFPDSTVTAYFFEQSDGQFTLYGDVYPEVITTDHGFSYYTRAERRGFGYLTAEVLRKIDDRVDFAQYDNNPQDGVVDQIFIIVRSHPAATFTGVANLSGADAVSGRPRNASLRYDGVSVNWKDSGSYLIHERPGNIVPQHYFVRLMAHEFGHHLWNSRGFFEGGHIKPITTNRIPSNGTDRIGYVLMAGRGGGQDSRGDELISAFERDLLGWASFNLLNNTSEAVSTHVLRDAYTTGDLAKVVLSDDDPATADPALYIENRQRIGPFDRRRVWQRSGCRRFDLGQLRTTGLLVTMGLQDGNATRFDVLPADNTLELSITDDTYAGDLYGPETSVQLTPWTRPGTARHDGRPSWVALDNIRFQPGSEGTMAFDFIKDFRLKPTIREESWIGRETDGYRFEQPLRVLDGRTLHLEDAAVVFASGVTLEPEARWVIETGASAVAEAEATIRLEPEARLVIDGMLEVAGRLDIDRRASLLVQPGGMLVYQGRSLTALAPLLLKAEDL